MTAKVSVILPVYNSEKFLTDAVESVLHQTYQNIELIIVDDGSIDNSLQLAKKFQSNKVQIISQSNSGASVARNKGFEVATGEYIQYLDADDILSDQKIEFQIKILENSSHDTLSSAPWYKFEQNIQKAIFKPQPIWKDYKPINWLIDSFEGGGMMQTACWLIPRPLIEISGGWNPKVSLHDDGEFFCRVLLNAKQILFCEEAKVFYRTQLSGSLSQTLSSRAIESEFIVIESYRENILAKEDSQRTRHACMRNYLKFIYTYYPRKWELMEKAFSRIKELGFSTYEPIGGSTFQKVSAAFGFKNALKFRTVFDSLKKMF